MPGPNIPYTTLDYPQVIKQCFDEANDRLRVDAVATIVTPPAIEVLINQADDSVAIGDGTTLYTGTAQPGSKFSLDVSAYQAGTWSVGRTWTLSSGTDSISAVQSGTWNINNITGTISLPTGASTSANQVTANASLASIDSKLTAPISTSRTWTLSSGTDSVTVIQGTSPWVISGTVTANAGTNLNTSLLALDTSVNGILLSQASTTVGQKGPLVQATAVAISPVYTSGETDPLTMTTSGRLRTDLGSIDGSLISTGNGVSGTGVIRVAIASDNTAFSVNAVQSGTWNINNITGTISLPTGASTSATQTDGTQKTKIVDGSNTTVGPVTTLSGVNYLPVVTTSSATPGAAIVARSTQIAGSDGTNAQTISTDTSGRVNTKNIHIASIVASYSAAKTGLASVATATDIFTITGSASKTIKITKIGISTTRTTSGNVDILLLKRSTANSGGTSAAVTAVPHDSTNAAATGTVLSYTANPTTGTLVGAIRSEKNFINTVGGGSTDKIIWEFGQDISQPIVLRGTAEVLAINLNSVTINGSSFNISLEWTEES